MNDFEMSKLLAKARDTYGNKNQILVAMEELCELAAALAKFPRYENEQDAINKTRDSVLDEVADVYIVLNHVNQIFGLSNENINKRMDKKLTRLSRWLDTANSFEQTTKDRLLKEDIECVRCKGKGATTSGARETLCYECNGTGRVER